MEKIKLRLIVAAALFAPVVCFAGTTDESIAELNERVAVLGAQVRVLDMQLQLATKKSDLSKLSGGAVDQAMPALKSIEGSGSKMFATLLYADGAKVTVETGDSLPNSWTVGSIGSKSIVLKKGKQTSVITLRTPAATTSAGNPQ